MAISLLEREQPRIHHFVVRETTPSFDIRTQFEFDPIRAIDELDRTSSRLNKYEMKPEGMLGFSYCFPTYKQKLIQKLAFIGPNTRYQKDLDMWNQKKDVDIRNTNLMERVGLIKLLRPELVDKLTDWQSDYLTKHMTESIRQAFSVGNSLQVIRYLFFTAILNPSIQPEEYFIEFPTDWQEEINSALPHMRRVRDGSVVTELALPLAFLKILFPKEDFSRHIDENYLQDVLLCINEKVNTNKGFYRNNYHELPDYFALYILQPHITARITPDGKLDIQDMRATDQTTPTSLPILRAF